MKRKQYDSLIERVFRREEKQQESSGDIFYSVCHGFRLTERDDYFGSILTTFESSIIFGGSW